MLEYDRIEVSKGINVNKKENLLSHIKMGKEITTFSDIEIEKPNF